MKLIKIPLFQIIVIMKVACGLVQSVAKCKLLVCQNNNARGLTVTITWPPENSNVNHQQKYTAVLHSLTTLKVSTNLR
jgi:hypothetical protein